MTRVDDELGLLRYCKRCDDWYPLDREFWYFDKRPGHVACRACADARGRARLRRKDLGYVKILCDRCHLVYSYQAECHGCASRFGGPLTSQTLEMWGLAG